MINWVVPSIIGAILIGLYNLALEGNGKEIGNDYVAKAAIIMMILIMTGLCSLFLLLILLKTYPSSVSRTLKITNKAKWKIIIPGLLIVAYMFANIMALAEGGGIVMGIIGLNTLVTLFGGAFLYGDKINLKIVLSLIFAMVFISYSSYQSYLINK